MISNLVIDAVNRRELKSRLVISTLEMIIFNLRLLSESIVRQKIIVGIVRKNLFVLLNLGLKKYLMPIFNRGETNDNCRNCPKKLCTLFIIAWFNEVSNADLFPHSNHRFLLDSQSPLAF